MKNLWKKETFYPCKEKEKHTHVAEWIWHRILSISHRSILFSSLCPFNININIFHSINHITYLSWYVLFLLWRCYVPSWCISNKHSIHRMKRERKFAQWKGVNFSYDKHTSLDGSAVCMFGLLLGFIHILHT